MIMSGGFYHALQVDLIIIIIIRIEITGSGIDSSSIPSLLFLGVFSPSTKYK